MIARQPREAGIYERILKYLNRRPNCRALKYPGLPYGRKGHPDVYGVDSGRPFFFEVKRPGEHPTPAQVAELAAWGRCGAITGVVHSVDEAADLLDRPA